MLFLSRYITVDVFQGLALAVYINMDMNININVNINVNIDIDIDIYINIYIYIFIYKKNNIPVDVLQELALAAAEEVVRKVLDHL